MDLDSTAIWIATRSEEALKMARESGLVEDLFSSQGKLAWRYIDTYRTEYGVIPSPDVLSQNSGLRIVPIADGDAVPLDYVLDQMHERAIRRAIKYGVEQVVGRLEDGEQDAAVEEVLKLADHLRDRRGRHSRVAELRDIVSLVEEQYELTKSGKIGIPFPWPAMNDATMGMWPGTLTFFTARPGVGKCCWNNTAMVDPTTGVRVTLEEMVNSGRFGHVTTWSRDKGVHVSTIDNKIDSGVKECIRLTTRTGRTLTVTPEHQLLTPMGWVRADEIPIGHTLASPTWMPEPLEPVWMADEEIDALAILLAEGSYTGNHVGISTVDEEVVRIATNAAAYFDVTIKQRGKCEYDFVRNGDSGPNGVRETLRRLGIDNTLSKHKTIPDEVFRLPNAQLARFVSIFWMCDGDVGKGGIPTISLASQKMVEQLQSLLLRFGVQSRLKYRPIKGGFHAWRLSIHSMSLDAFERHIPMWGELKGDRLSGRKDNNPNYGYPVISMDMKRELQRISKSGSGIWRGGLHQQVAKRLGRTQFQTRDLFGSGGGDEGVSIKMTAFKAFAEVYGIEREYEWWWNSDIFWDDVVSVENVGEQKVYDLTVLPTSCFVANDMVIHNSWTAINICWHAWKEHGKKVLIVSPEMGRMELAERIVALHGRISYGDIIAGQLDSFGGEKCMHDTVKELQAAENFYVLDDESRMEPAFIEEAIDAIDPDVIAVDSIYMLRVAKGKMKSGPGSRGGRYDRILATVDWMRGLSRRTQKPILGVSQLSRDAKMSKGDIERLKRGQGTGGLEDAVAMSDTLYMDAHNLYAMFQDADMKLDKQMMYVPLKARRQAKVTNIVTQWDMTEMNFSQIGTRVERTGSGGNDDFRDDGYEHVF